MAKNKIPPDLQAWIDARKQRHLSHKHVQMARELGMNPKKLGKIDNHKQEPWKAPLPVFIESLYLKRFGKVAPDEILTIEQIAARKAAKKAAHRAKKAAKRAAGKPPTAMPSRPGMLGMRQPEGNMIEGLPAQALAERPDADNADADNQD